MALLLQPEVEVFRRVSWLLIYVGYLWFAIAKGLSMKIYNFLLRRNKLLLIFACCPVFLGCRYEMNISPLLVALICLFLGATISRFLANDSVERKELFRLFCVVFSVSLIASAIIIFLALHMYDLPYVYGASDEVVFVDRAMKFSRNFDLFQYAEMKNSLEWGFNSPAWVWVIGSIMKFDSLFGTPGVVSIRIVNSLFLGIIALLTFKIGQRMKFGLDVCRVAGVITGLFPSMLVLGTSVLRDILIAMITVLCFYLTICLSSRILKFSDLIKIFILLLCIGVMFELRVLNAIALLGLSLFTIVARKTLKEKNSSIFLLAIMIVPMLLLGASSSLLLQKTSSVVISSALEYQEDYSRFKISKTNEHSLSRIVFDRPLMPFGVPLRLAYTQLVPAPIPSSNIVIDFEILGTIFRFFTFPFLLFGMYLSFKCGNLSNKLLLVWYLGLLAAIALTSFTVRQLSQCLPFGMLLMANGFYAFPRNRFLVFLSMMNLLCCLAAIYFVMKIL